MSFHTLLEMWVAHRDANQQIAANTVRIVEQHIRTLRKWNKNLTTLQTLLTKKSMRPHILNVMDGLRLPEISYWKIVVEESLVASQAALEMSRRTVEESHVFIPVGFVGMEALKTEAKMTEVLVWLQIQMLTILCDHVDRRKFTLLDTCTVLERLIQLERERTAPDAFRLVAHRNQLNNAKERLQRVLRALNANQRCLNTLTSIHRVSM